jgi:hypothetical protein
VSLQAKTDYFAKSLFLKEYNAEIHENRAESVELGSQMGRYTAGCRHCFLHSLGGSNGSLWRDLHSDPYLPDVGGVPKGRNEAGAD